MRLHSIHSEDLVLCSIKGRRLYGEVTEVTDGRVYFRPLCPGAGWRHAAAREVIGHWRKTGSRAATRRTDSPAHAAGSDRDRCADRQQ